jgi:hypothetical protein
MNSDVMKYLGGAGFLIFVYLVVRNAGGTTQVINSISKANTNAILALQGNNPGIL